MYDRPKIYALTNYRIFMSTKYKFPEVSLLITHYNRSSSLERLLQAFIKLDCTFGDIVVSDDGSRPEHLNRLKEMQSVYGFTLVTTPQNKGLGNNINKGQDAVKTPYTLYVQEDFDPKPVFPEHFKDAFQFMQERSDLDMVRFYAYFRYPYLKPVGKGFSEINFKVWYPGYWKFHVYSDHPHLRRTSFFQKFGRYAEGQKGDVTEYRMVMSFLKNKGKALFYDDYTGLFDQINSAAEPSTMKRNQWRESDNFLVKGLRHLYRHFKFNRDYFFGIK